MRRSKLFSAWVSSALILLVCGCAQQHVMPKGTGTPEVERLLSELDESAYVRTDRCLSTARYDHVEMVGEKTLLFRGSGDRYRVNELRLRCPMSQHDTLIFELRGSQACEFDTVRPAYLLASRWQKGPACSLGKFQEVNTAQAQLLKEALR